MTWTLMILSDKEDIKLYLQYDFFIDKMRERRKKEKREERHKAEVREKGENSGKIY